MALLRVIICHEFSITSNINNLTGPCSEDDSSYIGELEISKIKKTFLLCQNKWNKLRNFLEPNKNYFSTKKISRWQSIVLKWDQIGQAPLPKSAALQYVILVMIGAWTLWTSVLSSIACAQWPSLPRVWGTTNLEIEGLKCVFCDEPRDWGIEIAFFG